MVYLDSAYSESVPRDLTAVERKKGKTSRYNGSVCVCVCCVADVCACINELRAEYGEERQKREKTNEGENDGGR